MAGQFRQVGLRRGSARRDEFSNLDDAYNYAQEHDYIFNMHVLIWGNQQPTWLPALPVAEQREEIEEWFTAVAGRYPEID